MSAWLKTIAIAFALLGSVGTACADKSTSDPTDVLGGWSFQTSPYRDGACAMNGIMRLTPHEEDGRYQCELTAVEECATFGRSVVVQSCDARRFGNQVSVRSKIEQMLESKFESDSQLINYVPDNFALTIQNSERMFGALISAVSAPVEFRRMPEGTS